MSDNPEVERLLEAKFLRCAAEYEKTVTTRSGCKEIVGDELRLWLRDVHSLPQEWWPRLGPAYARAGLPMPLWFWDHQLDPLDKAMMAHLGNGYGKATGAGIGGDIIGRLECWRHIVAIRNCWQPGWDAAHDKDIDDAIAEIKRLRAKFSTKVIPLERKLNGQR